MNKYTFHLKGLNCANCASKIEKNLSEKNYLKNLRYNFFNDELVFESDRNLDELKKEIQKVVDSIEPGVIVIEDKKELDEHEEEEEEEEDYSIYKSIFVLITLIILNFVNISEKYTFVFYIVLYIIIGFDVVKSSVTKIIKRNFMDERFLMTIASIAAIVSGEYKEAVAVMLFYTVGEIIQDKAVDSSKKSIEEALKLKPDFANLLKDGEIIKVDPINVSVGERIIIKPGEKVPLD